LAQHARNDTIRRAGVSAATATTPELHQYDQATNGSFRCLLLRAGPTASPPWEGPRCVLSHPSFGADQPRELSEDQFAIDLDLVNIVYISKL